MQATEDSVPDAPFTPAWLADDPAATALLDRRYATAEGRREAVLAAGSRLVHPAVLATLRASTEAQQANRAALSQPGATCVVTGQQAGLFGGPLYTIYKAAAAIANARALQEETGSPCVPVFWLQNEDHDFDEIASTTVLASDGSLVRATVGADPGSPDRSIRCRRLDHSVLDAIDATAAALEGLFCADEVVERLRTHWAPGVSPDSAFRGWLEDLFAPHGLLVVDPSLPELREAAAGVHSRALSEADPIARALLERTAALQSAGFAVQVHVRDDAPLSFLHPEGPDGPRRRCAIHEALPDPIAHPGAYSTSALLRPILQDSWLPTAATVCGPGEIAYFAQLPPLYAHFGLPMPAIVPRARFRVVDPTAERLLAQLELGLAALDQPHDALLRQVARPGIHPDPDLLLGALTEPVDTALLELAPHAATLDPGLARSVQKTRSHMLATAEKLVDRYRRALATRDTVTVDRLQRLLDRLQPDGAPQERVLSWPSYAARHGSARFVDEVLAAVRPFDGTLLELRP